MNHQFFLILAGFISMVSLSNSFPLTLQNTSEDYADLTKDTETKPKKATEVEPSKPNIVLVAIPANSLTTSTEDSKYYSPSVGNPENEPTSTQDTQYSSSSISNPEYEHQQHGIAKREASSGTEDYKYHSSSVVNSENEPISTQDTKYSSKSINDSEYELQQRGVVKTQAPGTSEDSKYTSPSTGRSENEPSPTQGTKYSPLSTGDSEYKPQQHGIVKRQAPGGFFVYRPLFRFRRVQTGRSRGNRPSRDNALVGYLSDRDLYPTLA
ncbi:uncharacterized protein LOC115884860 isoform X2 [Sitophilus oryzae]|uniref:Uncharacterized protein LOC115884860 isoform X2 n=1 Tax=Sitophilus oryzae TaxID=7048 RepID=A0A6J2Y890_SITOR|nr:uncharacterized protein LOC115884860 isoform X2 [Sitophilus oryzae]